uniref:Uncharacterized protein n=1 Tax=Arundo donax TaxID=35708 RepID=A0A0A9GU96_ARUDO
MASGWCAGAVPGRGRSRARAGAGSGGAGRRRRSRSPRGPALELEAFPRRREAEWIPQLQLDGRGAVEAGQPDGSPGLRPDGVADHGELELPRRQARGAAEPGGDEAAGGPGAVRIEVEDGRRRRAALRRASAESRQRGVRSVR